MSHDPNDDNAQADPRKPESTPPPRPAEEDDDDALIAGELDEDAEGDSDAARVLRDQLAHEAGGDEEEANPLDAFAGMAAATDDTPRPTFRPPAKPHASLKATAVPLLATVGVLLLWPAMWSLMHLAGHQTEAGSRASADGMAKAMLIAWPIAFMLLGSALFLFIQVQKEKADHRAKQNDAAQPPAATPGPAQKPAATTRPTQPPKR